MLRDLLSAAVKKHNDIGKATDYALRMLDAHPEVKAEQLRSLIYQAVRTAVYQAQGQARHVAKHSTRGLEAIRESAATKLSSILDTWIVGGMRLGDWTGTQLRIEAAKNRAQAAGKVRAADFYEWIGLQAKDGKVRDVIDAARAQKAWDNILKYDCAEAV